MWSHYGCGCVGVRAVLKGLVFCGLVVSTAAFTHATVFDVNDPSRGLSNMHAELVIDP